MNGSPERLAWYKDVVDLTFPPALHLRDGYYECEERACVEASWP